MPQDTEKPIDLVRITFLALLVGVVAGVGAWAFRMLIGVIHNLMFLGEFSFLYDANAHTPASPWGVGVILVPVIGGLGVVWLVKNFAPEAKGHGVPEVVDAIYFQQGRIRPVVALVKSLASGLSIGSGGSVGREGPIIQIGAAFGSTLGQLISMPVRQRNTLIAAGAGAGIAATFNAPLGGVVFAIELLLVAVNASTLLPVTFAVVVASYIGELLIGVTPSFDIPTLQLPTATLVNPWALFFFVPLGLLMGLASAAFVRGIYWAEDKFEAMPGNDYTRHMVGMTCVGVMIYLLQHNTGHYYVQGVGYATIVDVLTGVLSDPWFLLLLFILKYLATCLTLGSGASGGVFSPSLFLGATMGAAYGHLIRVMFPELEVGPAAFAIAGMAGAVAGTTGAVLTGIIMISEMTGDYRSVLPVLVCVTTAYALRKTLSPESVYTTKLIRRGHAVPEGLEAAMEEAERVCDLMEKNFRTVAAGEPLTAFDGVTVIVHEGVIVGALDRLTQAHTETSETSGAVGQPYIVVSPHTGLVQALRALQAAGAELAIVCADPGSKRAEHIVGVMTARDILAALERTAGLL